MTPRHAVREGAAPTREGGTQARAERRALVRAQRFLREYGLLPLTAPPGVPSLVELVVEGGIRGSWWGHPAGGTIYRVAERLDAEPAERISLKLFDRRVTWVDRQVWPALLAVGRAGDPWQLRGLATGTHELLRKVDARGLVRGDLLPAEFEISSYAEFRGHAKILESRLLALVGSVHSASGAHALSIRSWGDWASAAKVAVPRLSSSEARREITVRGSRLANDTRVRWPWDSGGSTILS